jgi:hypothetical protein
MIAALLLAPVIAPAIAAEARTISPVEEVDAKFRKAMIGGDVEALGRVIADDAKIIHGNRGGIQTKDGLIRGFRSYHIEKYDRTPSYYRIDRNTAVLVSITRKLLSSRSVVTTTTEVLAGRGGRWQIVVLQNTDHGVG